MKIQIVTHTYKPHISPRAFRWTAIAERLADHGHHVDVVCNWFPGLERKEVSSGVHIWRTGLGVLESLRKKVKQGKVPAAATGDVDTAPPVDGHRRFPWHRVERVVKQVHETMWKQVYWPDYACMWWLPALRCARRLMNRHRHECLITVSHPFTGHLVGLPLKKLYPEVKWIVDIGDPFSFLESTPTNNHRFYQRLNCVVEGRILDLAGAVSVTTRETRDMYEDFFPQTRSKVTVIPPLQNRNSSEYVPGAMFPRDHKIRLVFTGTLYRGIRNPSYLLAVFDKLLETKLKDRLELHFFGAAPECGEIFDAYRHLLGSKLFVHGRVSKARSDQAIRDASILVNIGNKTHYQLPSKVVEYMGVGKPIINIVSVENDSSRAILQHYPSSIILRQREGSIDSAILDALVEFVETAEDVDLSGLKEFLAQFELDAIVRSYESLIGS